MNFYFTVFTLHSLYQYIVVFLGYFWLSRLKPKKQKTITLPLRRTGVVHTVLLANTPHLPLQRSSPEGATTEMNEHQLMKLTTH